jgi:hypothetical protein
LRRVPSTGGRAFRAAAIAIAFLACASAPARKAGALGLPTSFNMSPSSGPVGTTVKVSGTGCTGFILRTVTVTAATVPQTVINPSVAADGSWHGSFSIPAATPAAPVVVAVLCVSDGLSLAYTPRTFTVTGSLVPTTVALPSPLPTLPNTPATTVPSAPIDPSFPGSPNPDPSSPVSVPNDRIGNGTPGGSNRTDESLGSGNGADGDAEGWTAVGTAAWAERRNNPGPATRAAALSSPDLLASNGGDGAGLGWLLWVLALSIPIAGGGFSLWMRRARRPDVADPEAGSA